MSSKDDLNLFFYMYEMSFFRLPVKNNSAVTDLEKVNEVKSR